MHYTDYLLREHNARVARGVQNYERRCAARKVAKPARTWTLASLRALLVRPAGREIADARPRVRQSVAR